MAAALDVGVDLGIVRKSGAWFYLDEERIGQGRENAKATLKASPELAGEIERRIKAGAAGTSAIPVLGAAGGADGAADGEDPDRGQLAVAV